MRRTLLLPLLLVTHASVAQSLSDRIEAKATESVAEILSDTVETTLVSEGREPDFAACVGRLVEMSFMGATPEQRKNDMRDWIDSGKQQCARLVATADAPPASRAE